MAKVPDYYRVLQVSRHAEPEVIERAYKALALKYHPDRAPAEEKARATRRLQSVNEAYSVLSDAARRKTYDRTLPGEGAQAWDRFVDAGLWGIFKDWVRARPKA
jgi:DnaJ-class molecular chaperone